MGFLLYCFYIDIVEIVSKGHLNYFYETSSHLQYCD